MVAVDVLQVTSEILVHSVGPFLDGEGVRGLLLNLGDRLGTSQFSHWYVAVAAFNKRPARDASDWDQGRPFTEVESSSTAGNKRGVRLSVPESGVIDVNMPIKFEGGGEDLFFLGLRLDTAGILGNSIGSLWADVVYRDRGSWIR